MALHLWHTYVSHLRLLKRAAMRYNFLLFREASHRSCTCRHKKVGCAGVDRVITRNVAPTHRTRSNGITLAFCPTPKRLQRWHLCVQGIAVLVGWVLEYADGARRQSPFADSVGMIKRHFPDRSK